MDALIKALEPFVGEGMLLFVAAAATFVALTTKLYRDTADAKASKKATEVIAKAQAGVALFVSTLALFFTWMLLSISGAQQDGSEPQLNFVVPILVVMVMIVWGAIIWLIAKKYPDNGVTSGSGTAGSASAEAPGHDTTNA